MRSTDSQSAVASHESIIYVKDSTFGVGGTQIKPLSPFHSLSEYSFPPIKHGTETSQVQHARYFVVTSSITSVEDTELINCSQILLPYWSAKNYQWCLWPQLIAVYSPLKPHDPFTTNSNGSWQTTQWSSIHSYGLRLKNRNERLIYLIIDFVLCFQDVIWSEKWWYEHMFVV